MRTKHTKELENQRNGKAETKKSPHLRISASPNHEDGFTIAELIMVVVIFVVLTTVVIFNYGNFNNNIIITNMAYEVALSVRQAQVYSLGVRGLTNEFDTNHGIYIEPGANNKNLVFFADIGPSGSPDGVCDDGSGNNCSVSACTGAECQQLIALTRGVEISDICTSAAGNEPVVSGSCDTTVSWLSVTFERPNPNAVVYSNNGLITDGNAGIILEAPNAEKRAIIIRNTGQISVEVID